MKRTILQLIGFLLLWSGSLISATSPFVATENLPISMQGRIRSLDSAARLWLYDIYHAQTIKSSPDTTPLDVQWRLHFQGHQPFDNTPLFWIHYADLKRLLELDSDLKRDRFSFNELTVALISNPTSNLKAIKPLIAYEYSKAYNDISNRSRTQRIELKALAKGLWATLQRDDIVILTTPGTSPWHHLSPGMVVEPDAKARLPLIETNYRTISSELAKLLQTMGAYSEILVNDPSKDPYIQNYESMQSRSLPAREIQNKLEQQHPLSGRLSGSGSTLKMLPSRLPQGDWISLNALMLQQFNPQTNALEPIANFTTYSDEDFIALRRSYILMFEAAKAFYSAPTEGARALLHQTSAKFAETYYTAYNKIEGASFKKASGKSLSYPSKTKLAIETLYYKLPLIEIASIAYLGTLILLAFNMKSRSNSFNVWALSLLLTGFVIHTIVLTLRCYILSRPPVSNMFETVIYVPWVALATGLTFYVFSRSTIILSSATLASLALLILLKVTNLDSRLENVQAVLDSQYWLIIHVLMVVGSYGAFAVCGVLGHFYLYARWKNPQSLETLQNIARATLYTMYVGVALLIPGTILGGVWAAESWGRFWDWDPKESWAFISACVYLLIIHAYTFRRVADKGLAIGAICGLMAISFTWYGVNYILGAGLHTYGFGNGGEGYYFAYLAAEVLYIIFFSRGSLGKKLLEVK